jgi:hypothetical protein
MTVIGQTRTTFEILVAAFSGPQYIGCGFPAWGDSTRPKSTKQRKTAPAESTSLDPRHVDATSAAGGSSSLQTQ